MTQYWISFRSLTYAQRAAAQLERKGVTATIVRLPQQLSKRGCGYAVIVRGRLRQAADFLGEARITWSQVFQRLESGEFQEVEL
ncbi:MAG: DUF3343 domain-containing protein [Oscillospiraceae bacterium]|nr:DUF3343 domain-containing protein [Oscillospiraceae bacterium]